MTADHAEDERDVLDGIRAAAKAGHAATRRTIGDYFNTDPKSYDDAIARLTAAGRVRVLDDGTVQSSSPFKEQPMSKQAMTKVQRETLAFIAASYEDEVRWCTSGRTTSRAAPHGTKRATLDRLTTLGYLTCRRLEFTYEVGVGRFGKEGRRTVDGVGFHYRITSAGRRVVSEQPEPIAHDFFVRPDRAAHLLDAEVNVPAEIDPAIVRVIDALQRRKPSELLRKRPHCRRDALRELDRYGGIQVWRFASLLSASGGKHLVDQRETGRLRIGAFRQLYVFGILRFVKPPSHPYRNCEPWYGEQAVLVLIPGAPASQRWPYALSRCSYCGLDFDGAEPVDNPGRLCGECASTKRERDRMVAEMHQLAQQPRSKP